MELGGSFNPSEHVIQKQYEQHIRQRRHAAGEIHPPAEPVRRANGSGLERKQPCCKSMTEAAKAVVNRISAWFFKDANKP
jgi:hypothetical protein